MMAAVSSAAAPLRSTQSTCAPSRAKVTAVALPLPQPGPIEPAPTTIAVLPLSRGIGFSLRELVGHSINCRHSGMRLFGAGPESILTNGGYGFRARAPRAPE